MGKRATGVLLVVLGALALGSCVDEGVVYDERPIFSGGIEEAGGFVGYADPSNDDKLTICGACHRGVQAEWEGTAHAFAWEGLMTSDHAQEFCEACHSVNSLGNTFPEDDGAPAGGHAWVEMEDGRYLDVQCESCHGPALDHVLSPGAGNVPLAPFQTGSDLTFGCGECHSGTHHPFVEEWELSDHADPDGFAASNEEQGCYSCHSGEGALQRFGVTADYLEKTELLGSPEYATITCAVCHDPHGSDNAAQLRRPIVTTDVEMHLCAECHDRHPQPDTEGRQEYLRTHAPAAGLIAGTAGWYPPGSGLDPGELRHPHGTAERLCASCHVVGYSAVDEETGEEFFSKGHRFLAAPCADPDTGRPTLDQQCALTAVARDFQGCLECHSTEEEAAALLREAVAELLPRVRTLVSALAAIDPNGTASGGEIDKDDFRFTAAEGAYFNLTVALSAGGLPVGDEYARRALAAAVTHNPALVEALVEEALDALAAEYGALRAVDVRSPSDWPAWPGN